MNELLRQQIAAIHASSTQLVVAATGGGTTAIGELLTVPGGSRTLLEAVVPYSEAAIADWLHGRPESLCSETAARAMAMAAFERARLLAGEQVPGVAGVAVTASLATDRPKRGPHRAHAAWQTISTTAVQTLEFKKGARPREQEETATALLLHAAMCEACGLRPAVEPPLFDGEQIVVQRVDAPSEWQELLQGTRSSVAYRFDHQNRSPVLFPGAFNPLHHGHLAMAQLAESWLGGQVVFELSMANVDKPPLDFLDVQRLTEQFKGRPLLLTRAATFVEKAQLHSGGVTFVVGVDTISRIGQAKYYGGDPVARDDAVRQLSSLGCRFLVFGRESSGKFETLADLDLPQPLGDLCEQVPEIAFRENVSSTGLRDAAGE